MILRQIIDLDIGSSEQLKMPDGTKTSVKVLAVDEDRDPVHQALRKARVKLLVNSQEITIESGNYNLPQRVDGLRVDCPASKGLASDALFDFWHLDKDVRLRFWPADGPLISGDFTYPSSSAMIAGRWQVDNEPVVCGDTLMWRKGIYYHAGVDIGGVEGCDEIYSATDGLVILAHGEVLPGYENTPAKVESRDNEVRTDTVYILDNHGWFYRYSHFNSVEERIRPGFRVKSGDKLGLLGKEGSSGGWAHLHFQILTKMTNGEWVTEQAFAYLMEAWCQEHQTPLLAMTRPHVLGFTGQTINLDARKSLSFTGQIKEYQWMFCDGSEGFGETVSKTYSSPGFYSEIVKVTDDQGYVDYDVAIVQVVNRDNDEKQEYMTLHGAFYPSINLHAGMTVTFKARALRCEKSQEKWYFGDGSKVQFTESKHSDHLQKDGYAGLTHIYEKPGTYFVRIERISGEEKAVEILILKVEE